MALLDVKTPYEVLIRYGMDGLPRGAHSQMVRTVTLDGEILKQEILAAQPLDLAGFSLSALMTTTTQNALVQVTALTTENAELKRLVSDLQNEILSLQAQVSKASAVAPNPEI